jgi:protein-tyrosine phosphatase
MYKFAAASEQELTVFGSARPGFSEQKVRDWLEFMKRQKIGRVCCLLPKQQLIAYSDLLGTYEQEFGHQRVCWAPIEDFTLADFEILSGKILPFLVEADQQGEKVVVHCGGGVGRTGHVLAAWLVHSRGFSNQAAITAVKQTGRNPYEAAIAAIFRGKNPLKVIADLESLLNQCRLPE